MVCYLSVLIFYHNPFVFLVLVTIPPTGQAYSTSGPWHLPFPWLSVWLVPFLSHHLRKSHLCSKAFTDHPLKIFKLLPILYPSTLPILKKFLTFINITFCIFCLCCLLSVSLIECGPYEGLFIHYCIPRPRTVSGI